MPAGSNVGSKPAVGLSVMPEPAYLTATLPLFEAGDVDTIEWSFDMAWRRGAPDWLAGLIADYESAGRLAGHGVSLSPLSNHPRQDRWFERFGQDVANHHFTHVSEHFGFMAAGDFRRGPPLPLPMTHDTLEVGRNHLRRLASLTGCPVGLENLAFAFGSQDVWTQGEFLEELLAPVDGFLVLDVHNLWCQVHNFGVDAQDLLATYPIERVRECHVSGGSWSTAEGGRKIRRDTHDGAVPDEVFGLLEVVLARCPHVERIIVEQIGGSLGSPGAAEAFRADYRRVRDIAVVAETPQAKPDSSAAREVRRELGSMVYPADLMRILADSAEAAEVTPQLRELAPHDDGGWSDWVGQMDPAMISIAQQLMRKWAVRG